MSEHRSTVEFDTTISDNGAIHLPEILSQALHKGTKVSVLREGEHFVEIERPGDFKGWISKESLQENISN
mgnify:CR=1 FL=1